MEVWIVSQVVEDYSGVIGVFSREELADDARRKFQAQEFPLGTVEVAKRMMNVLEDLD